MTTLNAHDALKRIAQIIEMRDNAPDDELCTCGLREVTKPAPQRERCAYSQATGDRTWCIVHEAPWPANASGGCSLAAQPAAPETDEAKPERLAEVIARTVYPAITDGTLDWTPETDPMQKAWGVASFLSDALQPAAPETERLRAMTEFEKAAAIERDQQWSQMEPSDTVPLWSRERLADAYFMACYDRRGLLNELGWRDRAAVEAEAAQPAVPETGRHRYDNDGEHMWWLCNPPCYVADLAQPAAPETERLREAAQAVLDAEDAIMGVPSDDNSVSLDKALHDLRAAIEAGDGS